MSTRLALSAAQYAKFSRRLRSAVLCTPPFRYKGSRSSSIAVASIMQGASLAHTPRTSEQGTTAHGTILYQGGRTPRFKAASTTTRLISVEGNDLASRLRWLHLTTAPPAASGRCSVVDVTGGAALASPSNTPSLRLNRPAPTATSTSSSGGARPTSLLRAPSCLPDVLLLLVLPSPSTTYLSLLTFLSSATRTALNATKKVVGM